MATLLSSTQASPASAAEGPAPGRPGLGYRPGLDGLRGLAVAAVLCYHGEFAWAKGGFLGVSTFFTLSGFLITTLALDERLATGRIALAAFWRRRFRRLLPASLMAIGLAIAMALAVGENAQRVNLPGDVLGALAYVANWRFLLSDQSYADLFAAPSPLLHFWSLAIEEQFYLLFPLVVAAVWWLGRRTGITGRHADDHGRDRRFLGGVLVVLAIGSLCVTLFAGFDQEHIYMGTLTRAFEILVGGLLAVAVHTAASRGALGRSGRRQWLVAAIGTLTLAGAIAAWMMIPQTDENLYRGGLAVYALASTMTVLAASLAIGPVAALLSTRPLVHLGRISYGVYLYHWPVFLWLRQGTNLGRWPVFLIGSAVAVGLAEASSRWLERPVRIGRPLLRARPWKLAAPAIAALVVASVLVKADTPPPVIDLTSASETMNTPSAPPPPPTTWTPEAGPPSARVAFVGDSTGLMTGYGFTDWLTATGRGLVVPGGATLGCSLMGGDALRLGNRTTEGPPGCPDWPTTWAQVIADGAPNTVVVQMGAWDVQDRRVGDDPTWRGPGDPVYDEALRQRMLEAVDILSADRAMVVWLQAPIPTEGREGRLPDPAYDAVAPRMARINELIGELPSLRPGRVMVVDLAGWFEATGEQERLRPDGMHFSRETAGEVAERFLGPAILGPDWWNRPLPPPG